MIIRPIIPIALMAVICIVLLVLKRRGIGPYIRQIIIVILLFVINLRIMVPNGEVTIEERDMNMNVVFVIDNTISMVANDYGNNKTRLEGVNECADYIIDELNGAKFSIVTFNKEAKLIAPFTKDGNFAKTTLEAIYPLDSIYSKGTTLNVCRDVLFNHLKDTREKTDAKIVLFFISDGENTTEDKLKSFSELAKYVDGGAVLGFGTDKGGTMSLYDKYTEEYKVIQDYRGYETKDAVSKIDEGNLKAIADDVGITYVHMEKPSDIDSVISKLSADVQMEPTEDTIKDYTDIYYIFVIPLLGLLGYEFFAYRKYA